jgi:Ca-activated chloride channel family protein
MLLSLVLIPFGAALYSAIGRRRRRHASAFGDSAFAGGTAVTATRLRYRLPAVFLVLGFSILAVALARPQSVVSLPRLEGTVILAFDVSGSMAAEDFVPSRMEAAKAAARDFVAGQPAGIVVGVVAFSDSGFSVQVPTSDRTTIVAAIDRLNPERGTSLAQGILTALHTIAVAESGEPTNFYSNRSPDPSADPTPLPEGTYAPAVVVLLTDGENNEEPDPLLVAQEAADRGVRIHTIGLGDPAGVTLETEGFRVHTSLNEPLLRQISETTDGTYYGAETQRDLGAIYDNLETRLAVRPEALEITAIFVGAGIIVLLLGVASSLLWLGRLP